MTEPTQPHDKLLKGLLDQPGTAGPPLRASLLALRYSHRDGDTEALLVQTFTDARDLPSLFSMLVVYATTVYAGVNPALLRRAIHKVKPEWEDEMLSIAAKEWMAGCRRVKELTVATQ
ncbi:hypothetical protein WCLP8_410013 [uncultured Gammaproteobacteria bacterium]